jgi:amiloride-sensitive sodium channel subunit gamma
MGELLLHNVNNKTSKPIKSGYALSDLLINCTFNGRACYKNLTLFVHPNYGNCYTFDNDVHVETERKNNTPHFWSIDDEDDEDGYRLVMELYLYQYEYITHLNDRAAFRIFIHRKHEIPILSQTNLFLAPTTFTKLIFSQRIISFSQQCQNDLTNDMKQIFNNSNHIKYSQALCFKLCEFRYIETHYQCVDSLFMVFFRFFTKNQTKQLNSTRLCNENQCSEHRKRFSKNF